MMARTGRKPKGRLPTSAIPRITLSRHPMHGFRSLLIPLLAATPLLADDPKKLLLVGQGPDGHPPMTHEYMDGLKVLEKVLRPVKHLEVRLVNADGKWENGRGQSCRSDTCVLFVCGGAEGVSAD